MFKPGQTIKCTVTKAPRAAGGRKTLERLMRLQPSVAKGLRASQHKRAQTTIVYNRGNRDWVKRQTCGKIVRAVKGATFTMTYSVNLEADIASIKDCLQISAA